MSSALASAAGGLSSAAASAQAAASSAIASIKGGLDAKADVTLGAVAASSDGRVEVPLTVRNPGQQAYKYGVQVNFTDASGNLLDAVVVNVPEVAAGQSAQATAQSNRALSGEVKAVVANAVRY
ncbi:FxLYD domain-containing protein [Kitasatospora sp. NPDC004240]